jgi:hypothetical protein
MAVIPGLIYIGLLGLAIYELTGNDSVKLNTIIAVYSTLGALIAYYFAIALFALKGIRRIRITRKGVSSPGYPWIGLTRCSYAFIVSMLVPLILLGAVITIISFLVPCLALTLGLSVAMTNLCTVIKVISFGSLIYHSVMMILAIKGILNIQKTKRFSPESELQGLIDPHSDTHIV